MAAYAVSCLAAAVVAMALGFTPDAMADYRSGKALGGIILVMAGITAVVAIVIGLLTVVPVAFFVAVARGRRWRHPATYILFGAALAALLCWLTLMPDGTARGEERLIAGLILGGAIAGLVYWSAAVRPLHRPARGSTPEG